MVFPRKPLRFLPGLLVGKGYILVISPGYWGRRVFVLGLLCLDPVLGRLLHP